MRILLAYRISKSNYHYIIGEKTFKSCSETPLFDGHTGNEGRALDIDDQHSPSLYLNYKHNI